MGDVSVTAVCEMGNAVSPVSGVFLSMLSIMKSMCVCVYVWKRELKYCRCLCMLDVCVCVCVSAEPAPPPEIQIPSPCSVPLKNSNTPRHF